MTIFDWVNQIQYRKKSWDTFSEEEQKKFSPFIVNRFLSMDKEFIEVVNMFQKYSVGTLEPREVYKWYCEVLPKGKRYNKYIKGRKQVKYDSELVEIMCKYYEISKSECKEYLELISKEELKTILEMYGVESKKIRKFIK
tara:strand:+ start:167 stop:586 length:420 start_codon:yes stop_codon:yes gene_type:complete